MMSQARGHISKGGGKDGVSVASVGDDCYRPLEGLNVSLDYVRDKEEP